MSEEKQRIVNISSKVPFDVYIGRAVTRRRPPLPRSMWANPFTIGEDGDREDVVRKYRRHILADPALRAKLPDLEGKTLACWCYPQLCHGDVLLELLDLGETLEVVDPRGRCLICTMLIVSESEGVVSLGHERCVDILRAEREGHA